MEDVYCQLARCGYLRDGWRHWGSFGGVGPRPCQPMGGAFPCARGDAPSLRCAALMSASPTGAAEGVAAASATPNIWPIVALTTP
jgi:hypothetical protein